MKLLFTLLTCSLLLTTQAQSTISKPTPPPVKDTTHTLKSLLDAKKADFEAKASEEKKKIYAAGINDIIEKGVLKKAKQYKDKAPNFELKNAVGDNVALADLLKKGPVILTWYRGGWCPYCNITLNKLQQNLKEFKSLGATLVALTPEIPDKSLDTKEKHQLEFEVLSDIDNKVAREYGIVFKLTPDVAKAYQAAFNLHEYNKSESDELPLAATFVIDKNGTIRYAFVKADYRERAEPADIIEVLKGLQ